MRSRALGEQAEADARALLAGLPAGGAAEAVRARSDEVLERLRALRRLGAGGQAIRQHGDYHLGQVLWAGGDWLVSTSRASPLARSPSGVARARRCATSRACCARSPMPPRRAAAAPRSGAARWESEARVAVPRRLRERDRRGAAPGRRRRPRAAAVGLRAGEGALRAALRARQPAGLGARAGGGHPAPARRRSQLGGLCGHWKRVAALTLRYPRGLGVRFRR